ncbi:hypothetical protein V3C99_001015 [Haemonchus contortus]
MAAISADVVKNTDILPDTQSAADDVVVQLKSTMAPVVSMQGDDDDSTHAADDVDTVVVDPTTQGKYLCTFFGRVFFHDSLFGVYFFGKKN